MMVMFVWNRFRYDLVALLGLLTAVACGIVPVEKAFAGFSDSVVIIVASVLVISAGVGKSNVIGRIIRRLQPHMQTTGRQVLVLPATSPSVKKTVADLEAIGEGNVAVVAIIRGKNTRYIPAKHSTLLADDILVLQGDPHTLRTILEEGRLHLGGDAAEPTTDKHRGNLGVVEAVVMRNSPLVGCASTELKLRDRYNISLIGISRQG
jgi:di/tricarboxylate transporter